MITRKEVIALATLAFFGQATSIAAQEHDNIRTIGNDRYRKALVIGVNDYAHVPRLANAINDARSVSELLEEYGFEIVLGENLSNSKLISVLGDFSKRSSEADRVVIYFAGHGVQVDRESLLLGTDTKVQSGEIVPGALSVSRLLTATPQGKTGRLVLLDACRNHPTGGIVELYEHRNLGRSQISNIFRVSDAFARASSHLERTVLLFSTQPGHMALDGIGNGKNSPFVKALVNAMSGKSVTLENLVAQLDTLPGVKSGPLSFDQKIQVKSLDRRSARSRINPYYIFTKRQ